MILFKKANQLHNSLEKQHEIGRKVGFVPTMGALHQGHISLIKASKKENDVTVCSIFVNPTQFNDPKDYEKYPITIEKDFYQLETNGCDIIFLPSIKEIYPETFEKKIHYDLGYLETVLEGKFRPGHFHGVCMIVNRLLEIISCDNLYLGQKDYQQCMVIKRLIELTGKQEKLNIVICPTLREKDGLAMSSRNTRLNEDERKKATAIYQTLSFLKSNLGKANLDELLQKARQILVDKNFKIDYTEIADANTLELLTEWDGKRKIVALVAAFMNEVRLIDNMVLN
jgi:pantoate--beta-alanine ligase